MSSRTIIVAGAGIGGLTAALALAREGFRVAVLDQAHRLEEIGAGIQLSPNASGLLIALGLGEALRQCAVAPTELRVMDARRSHPLLRSPLGNMAERRYGAPYWVVHRGDLQAALLAAARARPEITLHLGARVEDYAIDRYGVAVSVVTAGSLVVEQGIALIGADGLWSGLRARVGDIGSLRAAGHTAWRGLVPASTVAPDLCAPAVNLWLGSDAHLVHYPVSGGRLINIVAVVRDDWNEPGWNAPGARAELIERFASGTWTAAARTLLEAVPQWRKWALLDRPPLVRWGKGPVTLLGDAAHPMLPYLAQGAAMAIEDGAVVARRLAEQPDDAATALRRYESERQPRTARVQRSARRNARIYHLGGAGALLRSLALTALGGTRLMSRYDWLYGWKPS
jgi:salicylate hydroxylase